MKLIKIQEFTHARSEELFLRVKTQADLWMDTVVYRVRVFHSSVSPKNPFNKIVL
mgnify:FL=1